VYLFGKTHHESFRTPRNASFVSRWIKISGNLPEEGKFQLIQNLFIFDVFAGWNKLLAGYRKGSISLWDTFNKSCVGFHKGFAELNKTLVSWLTRTFSSISLETNMRVCISKDPEEPIYIVLLHSLAHPIHDRISISTTCTDFHPAID
jgi:hypothetical protein